MKLVHNTINYYSKENDYINEIEDYISDMIYWYELAETKLENLGYICYYEKQQYRYMGELHNLQPNEVMVAIRKTI